MQDSLQLRSLFVPRLDHSGDTPTTTRLTHEEGIGQDQFQARYTFRPIVDTAWPPSYDVQGSFVSPCPSPFLLQGHRSLFFQDQQQKSWNCTSEDLFKSRMQASPTSTMHNFTYPEYSAFCAPATTHPPQPHQGYRVESPRKATSLNAQPVLATVNKNHHFPPLPPRDSISSTVSQNERSRNHAVLSSFTSENACVFLQTPAASSPISKPSSFSPCAMLSQNLKNDPHRQAKIKTEMCLHYLKGTKCPFGERCNYAHGEHELKFKTLGELEKHGIIDDAGTYRIQPCFSHVSTGSCPFGQRCPSIHDARVTGEEHQSCWLPHLEAPVNGLPGSAYVEKYYHERLRALRQKNPLVYFHPSALIDPLTLEIKHDDVVNIEELEWRRTYDRVSNLPFKTACRPRKPMPQSHVGHKHISELQRLQIALVFLEDKSDEQNYRSYIYQPSHLVYNELCMIVRTKYVRLFHSSDSAKVISKEAYHAHRVPWGKTRIQGADGVDPLYRPNDVIAVYEICFGPVGRKEDCRLYFDISSADIVAVSPQQVKKYKKKCNSDGVPGSNYAPEGSANARMPSSSGPSTLPRTNKAPNLDTLIHAPFSFAQPVCDDAQALCIEIVKHRIQVVRYQLQNKMSRFCCDEWKLIVELEREMKEKFLSLQRHHESILWPACREDSDSDLEIPPVRGPYNVKKVNQESNKHSGTQAANFIWESFIKFLPSALSSAVRESDQSNDDLMRVTTSDRFRLPVFQLLTSTQVEQSCEAPPFLQSKRAKKKTEACNAAWKSILLYGHSNEWEILKNHYNSSAPGTSESPSLSSKSEKWCPPQSFLAHDLPLSARALFSSSDESESD